MKILIVRFSSIGDIILTSPVVRCLYDQVEGSEIHYLTKAGYAHLLAASPYIEKIHVLEDDWARMITTLKQENFDLMIDLHHNLRTRLIRWNLRIPYKSVDKINFQKWLIVKLKVNRLPRKHIVDRYLATCEDLGVKNDEQGLDYFVPPDEEIDLDSAYPELKHGYSVYAIGGQHATKKLPENKMKELCEGFSGQLVLVGGLEDKATGDRISEGTSHVLNLCGELTVHGSASIIKQARSLITHDTGMMHIGAAMGVQVVSLWGNTIPEFGMYPYFANENSVILEVKDLPCRPCSKIGFDKCPKGHFRCMNEIPVERIISSLR